MITSCEKDIVFTYIIMMSYKSNYLHLKGFRLFLFPQEELSLTLCLSHSFSH